MRPAQMSSWQLWIGSHTASLELTTTLRQAIATLPDGEHPLVHPPIESSQYTSWLLDRRIWQTRAGLANVSFEWIEAFYNPI